MKWIVVVLAALLAFPCLADEASKQAKAKELLELMNARQMVDQMLEGARQMSEQQVKQMSSDPGAVKMAREMQDKVMALVQERLKWEKMSPEFVKLYAEAYEEKELDGIIAFYKSPAGKAMVAKMPALAQKSMEMAQQYMKDLIPEIQRVTREIYEKNK